MRSRFMVLLEPEVPELIVTIRTLEVIHTSVHGKMIEQIGAARKALPTHLTPQLVLALVHQHVVSVATA